MSVTDKTDVQQNKASPKRLLIGAFIIIPGLLVAVYFLFLRFNFSPLYSGLSMDDAALIAAELDRQEVRYRIEDQGSTISVPDTDIEAVRLSVYNSESLTRDLTGFELFNDSEMGLTDFAQKIKFQRAIQGELSRTLMMMDGVKKARVHVAIPERSIFRNQQTVPKSAVTIIEEPGFELSAESIRGIQHLVASSIPSLKVSDVNVVNQSGRIISVNEGNEVAETESMPSEVLSIPREEPSYIPSGQSDPIADEDGSLSRSTDTTENEPEIARVSMQQVSDTRVPDSSPTPVRGTQLSEHKAVIPVALGSLPLQFLGLIIGIILVLLYAIISHRIATRKLGSRSRKQFSEELSQALRNRPEERQYVTL